MEEVVRTHLLQLLEGQAQALWILCVELVERQHRLLADIGL